MVMRPLLRYVALYVAVELAAIILLAWAIGLGWTLLVLAAVFTAGVALAASQLKRQVSPAIRRRTGPQSAMADGVLVGLGTFLVFVPGVVSTAVGALMLAPRSRAAMRPLASGMIQRGMVRGLAAVNLDGFTAQPARGDYIDGEVIEDPVRPPARAAIARRPAGL